MRQRTCDSPAPVNGGPGCEGPPIQKKSCNIQVLILKRAFSPVSPLINEKGVPIYPLLYDNCCSALVYTVLGLLGDHGQLAPQTASRFKKTLQVDQQLAPADFFCNLTNNSHQVRRRHCSNPTPTNGGRYCQGKDMNSRPCSSGLCRPSLAVSRDLPVITDPNEQDKGIATSDLTLYIGLAVAFLIFVLVVFIIVRLLQRKRNPHPSYSYTPAGDLNHFGCFGNSCPSDCILSITQESILSIAAQIFCQHS